MQIDNNYRVTIIVYPSKKRWIVRPSLNLVCIAKMLCKEKEKENIKLQSVVLCANLSQIFFCNGPQKIFVALFDNIQLLPSLSHDTLHTWRLDFNGSLNKFGQKWRCCQLVSKYGMKVNLIPNIIA